MMEMNGIGHYHYKNNKMVSEYSVIRNSYYSLI